MGFQSKANHAKSASRADVHAELAVRGQTLKGLGARGERRTGWGQNAVIRLDLEEKNEPRK